MIICRCNEVTQKELQTFLKKHPYASLDELKTNTGASTNCGRCSSLIQKTYERLKNELPDNDQLRISF